MLRFGVSIAICGFLFGCATAPVASTDAPAELESSVTASEIPEREPAAISIIQEFPILEKLEAAGQVLAPTTKDWMEKWRGLNLEDRSLYTFPEISGSTSINLKVQAGTKSMGSFVPRNSGANPNIEVASFNMAALFGVDEMFRPTAPYDLGPNASAAFQKLIERTNIRGRWRLENRALVLKAIASGQPLKGCMKAKKSDGAFAIEDLGDSRAGVNGGPALGHRVLALVQASTPMPATGTKLTLARGYNGDALMLAREFSIIMTMDVLTEQWDRYSGGNIVARKDKTGAAHFYATDNGGATLTAGSSVALKNARYFSRFDRGVVSKIRELQKFFASPSSGYLGYTDPATFARDLGFRTEMTSEVAAKRLAKNIGIFLDRVAEVEKRFGADAFFP